MKKEQDMKGDTGALVESGSETKTGGGLSLGRTLWIYWSMAVLLGWFGMAWWMVGATAPERPRPVAPAVRDFMRQKLAHSQAILEGLTMEDFQLVSTHAKKLAALSHEANWRILDSPEYNEHSQNFRRNVEALVRSANLVNIDGATLAYVKVTMSCVECHKFVRGKGTG